MAALAAVAVPQEAEVDHQDVASEAEAAATEEEADREDAEDQAVEVDAVALAVVEHAEVSERVPRFSSSHMRDLRVFIF